ncbi:methyltransferase TYW3-domain-containing protein [Calycina marina]|uniref:tRNA(Phe) 7-[(3-amino-3-carboxypropyl)-4-demethylwyosine(37)-N(4)]-methyltransferase n=1 Tax=Calycina marina TaxID=1763456 RepID=A0A9P8CHE0_9HELO|nr:methyltransferase TYW3-domain-containing protein [Calycina marina]
MPFPQSFISKKRTILAQLAIPDAEYHDLSPKDSVDVGIRELIEEVNGGKGWVTTSSCAGRICVFMEGQRKTVGLEDDGNGSVEDVMETRAAAGGKGGGGKWLFVSHDSFTVDLKGSGRLAEMWGMVRDEAKETEHSQISVTERRFIHFKFEPMILHVLTASLAHAQAILTCALQAGFRESGIVNILPSGKEAATPMVAIRTQGTMLESLVGIFENDQPICNVPESYLQTLLNISDERFAENDKRIQRFRDELKRIEFGAEVGNESRKGDVGEWEDAITRRERKKAEGMRKSQLSREAYHGIENHTEDMV